VNVVSVADAVPGVTPTINRADARSVPIERRLNARRLLPVDTIDFMGFITLFSDCGSAGRFSIPTQR
jgi:hypothetical protein